MTKRSIITLAAVSAVIGSTAFAGPVASKPSKAVATPAAESCVTGDVGFDITSDYYFHGLLQQGSGFIIQPYGNLYFKVAEGGVFDSVSVDVGIWNSLVKDEVGDDDFYRVYSHSLAVCGVVQFLVCFQLLYCNCNC